MKLSAILLPLLVSVAVTPASGQVTPCTGILCYNDGICAFAEPSNSTDEFWCHCADGYTGKWCENSCGAMPVSGGVDGAEAAILEALNLGRSTLDGGNIFKLVWHSSLSLIARSALDRCPDSGAAPHLADQSGNVTFDVTAIDALYETGSASVAAAVEDWINEGATYEVANDSCSGDCDNYKKMIRADQLTVGCAFKDDCPDGLNRSLCLVGPNGGALPVGGSRFLPLNGTCDCPGDCTDKLCIQPPVTCAVCQNNATCTLDALENRATCDCADGYAGPFCQFGFDPCGGKNPCPLNNWCRSVDLENFTCTDLKDVCFGEVCSTGSQCYAAPYSNYNFLCKCTDNYDRCVPEMLNLPCRSHDDCGDRGICDGTSCVCAKSVRGHERCRAPAAVTACQTPGWCHNSGVPGDGRIHGIGCKCKCKDGFFGSVCSLTEEEAANGIHFVLRANKREWPALAGPVVTELLRTETRKICESHPQICCAGAPNASNSQNEFDLVTMESAAGPVYISIEEKIYLSSTIMVKINTSGEFCGEDGGMKYVNMNELHQKLDVSKFQDSLRNCCGIHLRVIEKGTVPASSAFSPATLGVIGGVFVLLLILIFALTYFCRPKNVSTKGQFPQQTADFGDRGMPQYPFAVPYGMYAANNLNNYGYSPANSRGSLNQNFDYDPLSSSVFTAGRSMDAFY